MKTKIISLGLAAVATFAVSATYAQETATEAAVETSVTTKIVEATAAASKIEGWTIAGVTFVNPLNANAWYDASEDELHTGAAIKINPIDPDFWMQIPSPENHSIVHTAFLNPATWAQFADVDTYAAMADMDVVKKWGELDTYAVFADPQTYAYRMQPGAFMHLLNAESYKQLVNPTAYLAIASTMMETASDAVGAVSGVIAN